MMFRQQFLRQRVVFKHASVMYQPAFAMSTATLPKPTQPSFCSGPTPKRPGYDINNLKSALLGRSHRSAQGKAKIKLVLDKTKQILGLPEDYRVAIVPASDTGAVEMAMWSLLGERPVDCLYWESFGKGWYSTIKKELKLNVNDLGTNTYGELPDLSKVNPDNDLIFTFNGTTSGVKVPKGLDFISDTRTGLTIADATSGIFSQDMTPYSKLDVITFSFQKVLGGEGAHGILILSPRAVQRLESYVPPWPMPKIFTMTKKGKLDEALFKDSPINTPSMLVLEDYLDALTWVESIGGVAGCEAKSNANLKVIEDFCEGKDWINLLCADKNVRSNTSVCLTLKCEAAEIKKITKHLGSENVAFDIDGYRDAPPSLRIWCGATVETEDLAKLMPWIEQAYNNRASL